MRFFFGFELTASLATEKSMLDWVRSDSLIDSSGKARFPGTYPVSAGLGRMANSKIQRCFIAAASFDEPLEAGEYKVVVTITDFLAHKKQVELSRQIQNRAR